LTEHEFIWEEPPRELTPEEEERNRRLRNLVDALKPNDTPFTQMLGRGKGPPPTPEFCKREKKESIEPYMTLYEMALDILTDVDPEEPSYEDWYTIEESPGLTKLRKLVYVLGLNAYKEVPNPGYDENQCRTWKEENMKTWNKVEWGMGSLVPVEDSMIITPDGPRVIDEGREE
jgi:hypothetical protein